MAMLSIDGGIEIVLIAQDLYWEEECSRTLKVELGNCGKWKADCGLRMADWWKCSQMAIEIVPVVEVIPRMASKNHWGHQFFLWPEGDECAGA